MATPRPAPELPPDGHKGDAGRVLFLCGQRVMPGAAILALRAAQRAGAGLATLGCLDEELLVVVPGAAPEAVYLDLSRSGDLGAGRLPEPLCDRDDHAWVIGPGLGQGPRTLELVRRVLGAIEPLSDHARPLVLDADALNVLGELGHGTSPLTRSGVHGPLVLTPHPGEAQRLLGRAIARDEPGRIEAARELARRAGPGALCCLKGAGTVVTDGERVHVNRTGNPGMATAGTGDVLAGIVGAYLASCVTLGSLGGQDPAWTPLEALKAAVHVHGLAGDLAAEVRGRRGLVAGDLVEFLPAAQQRFALG